nr:signal peptidase [uncultured Kingella sp.]
MIRRWLALTYYLYALRLAALSHFYFNRLYLCRLRPLQNPHLWHISSQRASRTLENISIFSARSAMLLL